MTGKKGFGLISLLITLAIIGVLTVYAIRQDRKMATNIQDTLKKDGVDIELKPNATAQDAADAIKIKIEDLENKAAERAEKAGE